MCFDYFYLYLFIGGEVILKKKQSKPFFHQPNPTLSKDKSQFNLVLLGEGHIDLM